MSGTVEGVHGGASAVPEPVLAPRVRVRSQATVRCARSREWVVLALVLGAALIAVWANDWGRFTPDTVPDLYESPLRLLVSDLSVWQVDPFLGSPQMQVGRLPVDAFMVGLDALGLPTWAMVRVWRSVLVVVAALGAHRLYQELSPGGSSTGRVVAASLYIANPYFVVGGSTTPVLLPYALLPWFLVALLLAARTAQWRWAAASALALFAMSGIQVGVVPFLQMLAVPCLLLHLRAAERVSWRRSLAALGRCGVLCLAVSLYWLVPGLLSLQAGSAVAGSTESLEAIAGPSSYAEVLRGLGMWTMYGAGPAGPFQPGFSAYLSNPLVVLASAALPVLAAVGVAMSRSRLRLLGLSMVVLSAPVMVGLFALEREPTVFGRALGWGFEHVPGLLALRTTNKAGSVLMLGLVLLVALLAEEVRTRLSRPTHRGVAGVALVAVAVGATGPAVMGTMYPVQLDVPSYWREAAEDLNAEQERTLVVPGEAQATYRWGYTSSADIITALFSGSTVLRQTVPAGSPEAANYLGALDVPLNEAAMPAGGVSTMAAYLGVDNVLVRSDTLWESQGGARPAAVLAQIGQDEGLNPVRAYGDPGENTVSSDRFARKDPEAGRIEQGITPLLVYAVADAPARVRAEPVAGTVLVVGDNSAVPQLLATGLLEDRPAFRLLGGMATDDLEAVLDQPVRLVLTDTNRRREANPARLSSSTGPTLTADETPSPTRALYQDQRHQSVAVLDGASSISASQSGTQFGPVPYGHPGLVLDGDTSSGWTTGDFGTALGQSLTLRLSEPARVDRLRLRALPTSPVSLTSVRIRVGDLEQDVEVSAARDTEVVIEPTDASAVEVVVTGTSGTGDNAVGLAELSLPDTPITPGVRLPQTLATMYPQLDPQARERLRDLPLDVLLSRAQGDPTIAADDEERVLARIFSLPDTRRYRVGGVLRAGPSVPEETLDRLAGVDPQLRAVSTSRWFGDLNARASGAFDANPATAWLPGEAGVRESVTFTFPPQQLDEVVVRQDSPASELVDLATEVRIEVDGGRSVVARVGQGGTVVKVPSGVTGSLKLTITGRAGTGAVIRLTDVEVPGLRMSPDPERAQEVCTSVGTVDSRPLAVRVDGSAQQVASGGQVPFASCSPEPLELDAGAHRVSADQGWLLDSVQLADEVPAGRSGQERPELTVARPDSTSFVVSAPQTRDPWYLVLGEAFDTGWRARVDGADLGRPIAVDGWSTGWKMEPGDAQRIDVVYAPSASTRLSIGLSAIALVVCAVLLRRRAGVEE